MSASESFYEIQKNKRHIIIKMSHKDCNCNERQDNTIIEICSAQKVSN